MMGKGLYRRHLKEKQERQAYLESLPITRCYTDQDGNFHIEKLPWVVWDQDDKVNW